MPTLPQRPYAVSVWIPEKGELMFYLHLHDAEPNSNYGEFVAAAYESEYQRTGEGRGGTWSHKTAEKAENRAWNRMVDRNV